MASAGDAGAAVTESGASSSNVSCNGGDATGSQGKNCRGTSACGGEKAEIYFNRKWRMELLKPNHVRYCRMVLFSRLPSGYEDLDTQRMTFLHFAVTSLDILKAVQTFKIEEKSNIINWIYHLQITGEPSERCGFQGSTTFKLRTSLSENFSCASLPAQLFSSHITMTYAALVTLLTLGDELARVDREGILKGVAALQNFDGSFKASLGCAEKDMRFVYCAVCTCYILNDFSLINVPKLVEFIKDSFTYEGSFSSGYGVEGHAAYTFCAVASLVLLNQFTDNFTEVEKERLRRWCLFRQEFGFSGRPNKAEDTCYSYWVVATLALLESVHMIEHSRNTDFILANQNPLSGGIGKCDNEHVDPLHTFMGLAGLSLVKYEGLNPINPMLTMSENAVSHMRTIHTRWASAKM